MNPFTYPSDHQVRRHGPRGYADPESYRPWLRDEFAFRCVYCLFREQWGRVTATFDIEHFLPVSLHPEQEGRYANLLYACAPCNAAKANRRVSDPTAVLLGPDVRVTEDGVIHATTTKAARLIELLGLDSQQSTEFRMLWLGIIALAARYDAALYRRLMGFPDDLPNLGRLRPPGGNTHPQGVGESYFMQRKNGVLPETY